MANPYKVGDKVKCVNAVRLNGKVKYLACGLATAAGGRVCDKKTCPHTIKDNVWVSWPDGSIYSYHHTELAHDASQPPAAAPTLPSAVAVAAEAEEASGDPKKDEYIEKAKAAIAKVMKPKPATIASTNTTTDFYRGYNGFDKMKYDRSGRPYIQSEFTTGPVIGAEELDWDTYNNVGPPMRKKKVARESE